MRHDLDDALQGARGVGSVAAGGDDLERLPRSFSLAAGLRVLHRSPPLLYRGSTRFLKRVLGFSRMKSTAFEKQGSVDDLWTAEPLLLEIGLGVLFETPVRAVQIP